ncbi:replication initiator [Streptomyces sp. NPDC087263]|uniref:replication initiator n=1 Tax=Streptomyces sp. NPDC087263 TaxID=3365773 RepID=UPI0037F8D35E
MNLDRAHRVDVPTYRLGEPRSARSRFPYGRTQRPRTAPSFGPVHHTGDRCRPRRDGGKCDHGRPLGCGTLHDANDPLVGQPLCTDCYDCPAHVLWHAHAGKLWDRFVIGVRRQLASAVGLVQSRLSDHARLSFARVAEYQKRAAVHVHAVVRLDAPAGPNDEPPSWASADRLADAVHGSERRVLVRTPYSPAVGELALRWGVQVDARHLRADRPGPDDHAVAAYLAKYVTKGASETGAGTDRRLTAWDDIDAAPVTDHVRALMHTCWRLGGLPEYAPLHLRAWAHTLGAGACAHVSPWSDAQWRRTNTALGLEVSTHGRARHHRRMR